MTWDMWIAALLLGVVVLIAGLALRYLAGMALERRGEMGEHHWLNEPESAAASDPDPLAGAQPDAEESLAAVSGLGEVREPGPQDHAEAGVMDVGGQPDLRGDRDRDPDAPNPWRFA